MFVDTKDKTIGEITTASQNYGNYMKKNNVDWAISAGANYKLVDNGKMTNTSKIYDYAVRPDSKVGRTMIGYKQDGSIVMVAVNDINAVQAAQIMKNLGCYNAIILDGSGSSQFYYNNKQTLYGDGRLLGNAIFVENKK